MYYLIKRIAIFALICFSSAVFAQELPDVKNDLGVDTKVDVNPTLGGFSNPRQMTKISDNGSEQNAFAKNEMEVTRHVVRKLAPSEFQVFIHNSTGKRLPVFGDEFFNNTPLTFAPIESTPVPSEYVLGAGDEILVRGWGSIDIDFHGTIDRNGFITIPTVGTVALSGTKAGDADGVIKSAIAKQYRDLTISVSFGRLRAITIYVVGQAFKPGSYTISGFSTLVTALLASGGPNRNGSMRNVQVKRNGKTVGTLDLYTFIAKGDKSGDVKLIDGDTIYIPAALGFVAVSGNVNSPGIYELGSASETIEQVLDLAGGLPVVADPRRAFLERIDSGKDQPRTVVELALDTQGLGKQLKNGDLLTVNSMTPDFANAVTLRGNVDQPLRVPFKTGMRIRDLIPTKAVLITRKSIDRQNNAIITTEDEVVTNDEIAKVEISADGKKRKINEEEDAIASNIGHIFEDLNWDYAVVERIDRAAINVNLIPFNLGNAMEDINSKDNLLLQAGDIVTVFSQNDVKVPMAKRKIYARIDGEVNVPGVYQMSPNDTLETLVAKAGGLTTSAYLFGAGFYRDQVRKEQQANLEKITQRLESQIRIERNKTLAGLAGNTLPTGASAMDSSNLKLQANSTTDDEVIRRLKNLKATGRIAFGSIKSNSEKLPTIKLENGDHLIIPNRSDFINVYGAVNLESALLWRKGLTVKQYLQESGPRDEADLESVFIMRADGSVLSNSSSGWFSSIASTEVLPGDSIVVPEMLNKETTYKTLINGLKDWAQILTGFGLGAAAIHTLNL